MITIKTVIWPLFSNVIAGADMDFGYGLAHEASVITVIHRFMEGHIHCRDILYKIVSDQETNFTTAIKKVAMELWLNQGVK